MNLLELRRRAMLSALEVEEYIVFADPVVEQICATTWGDGVGLKPSQAARVTDLGTVFKGNKNIVSFDELQYFTGLTSIFGSTNSSIMGAFYDCNNLSQITLPPTITSIGANAFRATLISTINIPNVTSIGAYAFWSSKITEINAPSLTSLGSDVFYNCTSLQRIVSLGSITSIANAASGGYGMFRDCTSLTSAVLPNALTFVGSHAFHGCSALTSCNLPQSITNIGESSFYGTKIDNVLNLPNLTSIGNSAFYGTNLTGITSLGSVTTITTGTSAYNGVFNGCKYITSVTLPSTLTTIGYYSFNGCTSLQSVTCSSSGVSLSRCAFYGCTALTTVNMKISAFTGYTVFYNCDSLVNLDFSTSTFTNTYNPDSTSNGTFRSCNSLKSVILPTTCVSIGAGTFYSCNNLETINLGDNITNIYTCAFRDCSKLKVTSDGIVTLNNVTHIGTFAFTTSKIVKITLPSIVTIDAGANNVNGAFYNNNALTYVDLGANCATIGAYTFRSCSALTTLICRAETPPTLGTNSLQSTNSGLKIYVPYSADHSILNAYTAASGWSSVAARIYELDANGNIPT